MTVIIQNDQLIAEIAEHGAELVSLKSIFTPSSMQTLASLPLPVPPNFSLATTTPPYNDACVTFVIFVFSEIFQSFFMPKLLFKKFE